MFPTILFYFNIEKQCVSLIQIIILSRLSLNIHLEIYFEERPFIYSTIRVVAVFEQYYVIQFQSIIILHFNVSNFMMVKRHKAGIPRGEPRRREPYVDHAP